MTARTDVLRDGVDEAIEGACRSIAPNWPLDRQIAVNPYWGRTAEPFDRALTRLHRQLQAAPTMEAQYYLKIWESGVIQPQHVRNAAREAGLYFGTDAFVDALRRKYSIEPALPLLSDCVDAERDLRHAPAWREAITQQVSQHCAAYFDRDQADWHLRSETGLYASWRAAICHDHSIALQMHAPRVRLNAQELPLDAKAAIRWALRALAIPAASWQELLEVCLLRINGWAAWCAYLRWEAELAASSDDHIVDLLAIRLAWECLLDEGRRDTASRWNTWQQQWATRIAHEVGASTPVTLLWQRAHEIAYQDRLFSQLTRARPGSSDTDTANPGVRAHVVFCIDVRSERFRRALEALDPDIATKGFAGFFGLPIRYTPLGTRASRPQLPGLLAPALEVTETSGQPDLDTSIIDRRTRRLSRGRSLEPFQRLPSAAFSLVESLGLTYAGKLLAASFSRNAPTVETHGLSTAELTQLRPDLTLRNPGAPAQRIDLAESILRAMSLTSGFARLLVLIGHGSHSANNPHAAGLDCGACGGQTGAINARVLARLLNDPLVRQGLRARGIDIPETTVAIAALHNTTTDEVDLFDRTDAPSTHDTDIERLKESLLAAGAGTRAERADALGLVALRKDPLALQRSIRHRAHDWAQTRPEWGLADNAAFIVAPREGTREIDLQGRSFLHDYRWQDDADGRVLELIMTAPMIVTHWINLQYYASTVAPHHFGSGNKILHNVVGGRIGVFEGNSGDLRIGLPQQSVHDGSRWMHTPLRLTVAIQAPRAMIERVLHAHPQVRALLDHEWLYVFRWDGQDIERYQQGHWQPWTAAESLPGSAAA